MLKVSQLYNMHVYAPKGGRRGKKAAAGEVEYGKIGRIGGLHGQAAGHRRHGQA